MRKQQPLGVYRLFHYFHDLAAAAGDDLAGQDVEDLMADGTVDVTFFFCPDNGAQTAFQFVFHGNSPWGVVFWKKQGGRKA